jgi:hypothetical protein
METRKADYEKDYLVINRKDGKFYSFHWYPSDNHSPEEVEKMLKKWNADKNRIEDNLAGELITDPLVREICGYRERAEPYETVINDAKDVQESIDRAQEYLKTALEYIDDIRGLD